jgi:hypothetical protein
MIKIAILVPCVAVELAPFLKIRACKLVLPYPSEESFSVFPWEKQSKSIQNLSEQYWTILNYITGGNAQYSQSFRPGAIE